MYEVKPPLPAGTAKNGRSTVQSSDRRVPSKNESTSATQRGSTRNVVGDFHGGTRAAAVRYVDGTPSGASNAANTGPADANRLAASTTEATVQFDLSIRRTMRAATSAR